MTPALLTEAEALAGQLADAAGRLSGALAEGDMDRAIAALQEHAALQVELEPRLASLHAAPATVASEARDRIAALLHHAFESTCNGEASLRQSRERLQARILATRRQATTAATYGAVDIPVSSGFQRRG